MADCGAAGVTVAVAVELAIPDCAAGIEFVEVADVLPAVDAEVPSGLVS